MTRGGQSADCAVVLTALDIEYAAIRAQLSEVTDVVRTSGTLYEVGHLRGARGPIEVVIAEIGKGTRGAAAHFERAISRFRPAAALFVGIAGSLKPESVRLGDVVVATKVSAYDGGKASDTFLVRPEVFHPHHALEQVARLTARSKRWLERIDDARDPSPRVHLDPIAAGNVLVDGDSSPLLELLKNNYNDSVAVEMEGSGFLEAARLGADVPAGVIRGISDLTRGKAATDAKGWQRVAARNAAAFAAELLVHFEVERAQDRDEAPYATVTIKGDFHGNLAVRDYYEGRQ